MKQKKRIVGFSIAVLLIATFMFAGGTTLINNVVSRLTGNDGVEDGSSSIEREVSCIVGDSDYNEIFDVRDLVRLERYFGNAEASLVTDVCSLDGDWNVNGELDATKEATIYDYTKVYKGDAEICLQMLVEDPPSLQVKAKEGDYYKQMQDKEGRSTYYTLNKALKEGWVLTFKIKFPDDGNYSVGGYYPGCEEWLDLGTQANNEFVVTATEDITNLNIRVSNESGAVSVSEYLVYDIQVIKHNKVTELEIVYDRGAVDTFNYDKVPKIPIVYGTNDTLDMTRFGVQTETAGLEYDWILSYNGVVVSDFSKTDTAYTFDNVGTYTLTAKVKNNKNKTVDDVTNEDGSNYSGEVSAAITVLDTPTVYMDFRGGQTVNLGSGNHTVGTYTTTADDKGFIASNDPSVDPSEHARYYPGIDGDSSGSLRIRHTRNDDTETYPDKGAYAVIENYQFGTDGTDDFTISTWINAAMPNDGNWWLSPNAGTYLFGNANPGDASSNEKDGSFMVLMREDPEESKNFYLHYRVSGIGAVNVEVPFSFRTWSNVALRRDGDALELYFNGELVHTQILPSGYAFKTSDLAFGGYYGYLSDYGYHYHADYMYYDDIQVYSGPLASDVEQIILAPRTVEADIEVLFEKGTLKNTGLDKTANVGAYQLKEDNTGSEFVPYIGDINYTTGIHGDKNGAMISNYAEAPYTVIKDYAFNTDNFTVSTWFKIPNADTLTGDQYAYLMGIANPKAATGFSVTLEQGGVLHLNADGTSKSETVNIQNFMVDKWYHLAVSRSGSKMSFFLNGALIYEEDVTTDFATKDIAFGAYTGLEASEYKDSIVFYDNIKVFKTAKSLEQIQSIFSNYAKKPDVYVNYNNSLVKNDGERQDIEANTYVLDQLAKATMFKFESVNENNFFNGFDNATDGALSTNHKNGPYTVVRDYVFGKENFTISTMFKVPEDGYFNNTASIYLFGTDHSDATEDFSLCIKTNDSETQQLRFKLLDKRTFISLGNKGRHQVAKGSWYRLTLTREGGVMKLFLNDELKGTFLLPDAEYDFGTTDLAFGGYYGFEHAYVNTSKHYDEVEVYGYAMKSDIEQYVATSSSIVPEVEVTYTGGKIENTGKGDYKVNPYKLSASKAPNEFKPGNATYTIGMEGDVDGATSLKHSDGTYTVVEKYNFGANDFSISTWFNSPLDTSAKWSPGGGTYLFGTAPTGGNGTDGFSVALKCQGKDGKEVDGDTRTYLRLQVGKNGTQDNKSIAINLERSTWHNLVLTRKGNTLSVYLNGEQIYTASTGTISFEGCDFGIKDLSFGGYPGSGGAYHGNYMYYDNIRVYGEALPAEFISYSKEILEYRAEWALEGRSKQTTLFIGDEFFDPSNLSNNYYAKDVEIAGIANTTTYDWNTFVDSYLAYTSPKNLVAHVGFHNIYTDNDSADATIQNLKALFTKIHKLENYIDTQIYYFGIPYSKAQITEPYKTTVDKVNEEMAKWCSKQGWITYVGDLTGKSLTTDYSLVVNALAETDVVIEDGSFRFEADTTYRTEGTVTKTANTLSTWLHLCTDFADSSRGGIIWGNYKKDAIPFTGYEIYDTGRPRFIHVPEGGSAYKTDIKFDVDIRDNSWVNLTFVIGEDARTVSCYVNGVLKQTKTAQHEIKLNEVTNAFMLGGGYAAGNEHYFKGRIRELALYEGVLTSEDVMGLYTNGLSSVAPFTHYQLQFADERKDVTDTKFANNLICNKDKRYFTDKDPVTDYAYSFAVIGDPQIISINDIKYGNQNLPKMYDWILENKDAKNIKYVFNMGDITDGNRVDEWTNAAAQNARMDGKIPYSVVRGNHDLVGYNKQGSTDYFSQYMGTDAYRSQFVNGGFYEEDDISNSWRTLTIGKTKYLLLALDFGVVSHWNADSKAVTDAHIEKADKILAWADGVVESHPDHKVILTTHAYMNNNGTTLDDAEPSNASENYGTYDGDDLWNKFVKKHKNIVLVMSGHIDTEEMLVRQDKGIHGNTVTSMLINFQGVDRFKELTGTVTMLYFSEDGKTIQVENIATAQGNKYFLRDNQFTIELDKPEVDIDFTGGKIVNKGISVPNNGIILNTDAEYDIPTVGAYRINAADNGFDPSNAAQYVTGRDGDPNGALKLYHDHRQHTADQYGAYAVVKEYEFGKNDFTISAWFNKPAGQGQASTGANTYLFGISQPDDTREGSFSVTLKEETLRFRVGGFGDNNQTALQTISYKKGEWNQVILSRKDNVMNLYFNGQLVSTADLSQISAEYDFGTKDLAFGGYHGWGENNYYTYADMYFDDIQIYRKAVELPEAAIEITYTGGKIENIGSNQAVVVGAYKLNANDDGFEPSTKARYTTGMYGDANGALSLRHNLDADNGGAYTVVKDYPFGMKNFTVSTWFNVNMGHPTWGISTGAGTYLLGNSHPGVPNSGDFALMLQQVSSDSNKYQLAFRVNGATEQKAVISCSNETWNNVVLTRERNALKLYYNGKLVITQTLEEYYNIGTRDLAFGGYYGYYNTFEYYYHQNVMCYDNIKVYGKALTQQEIAWASKIEDRKVKWSEQGNAGKTTLFVGDSFFDPNFWTSFYDTYEGKDVLLTGIGGTTAHEWDVWADTYLANTSPKNLVVHLGTNDIHVRKDNAETVIKNLKALFTKIHALNGYENTQIYYFGIPDKKDGNANNKTDVIDAVNAEMQAWCEEREWITYIDVLTGRKTLEGYFSDDTHLTQVGYDLVVNGLKATDIEMVSFYNYGAVDAKYDVETYPFVVFDENGKFVDAYKNFGMALSKAKAYMGTNEWDADNNIYVGNPLKKAYVLLRRDYTTSSESYTYNSETTSDTNYANMAQLEGEMVIDLNGYTITQGVDDYSIFRQVTSKGMGGKVFPSTYTIINGEFEVTKQPLLTLQTWESVGNGAIANKIFTFNFNNVKIGYAEGGTATSLLFNYYDYSKNNAEPTAAAPFFMNFKNCTFDMSNKSTGATLFNIATTEKKWLTNTVTVTGGEIIANDFAGVTLINNTNDVYNSSVTFIKNAKGEYAKFTHSLNTAPTSTVAILNEASKQLKFVLESSDASNSIYKFKLSE